MKTLFHTIVWLLEVAISLAFLLLLLLAILPWLLSMGGTRSVLLALVNSSSGKHIAIEEVSLHWFGPQHLKGITLQDDSRRALLCCDEINTDASLWQIIAGSHDIGNLRILAPYLVLQTETTLIPSGARPTVLNSGFSDTSLADFCSLGGRAVRRFSGQIDLQRGTLEITGPKIEPIFFNSVKGTAKFPSAEATQGASTEGLAFQFQGTTSQRASSGEIQGDFHFTGTLTPCNDKEAVLALQGAATRLPVTGLDQIASLIQPKMRGMLVAALGSTLNLTTSVLFGKDKGELALELTSPQAKASFFATTQEGSIILRTPASCSLTLTPALFEFLFATSPYFRGISLSSSSQLQFALDSLAIPLADHAIDWRKLNMKGDLHLTNINFKSHGLLQEINLTRVDASITSEELQKELIIDAGADLHYADFTSTFASVMQISLPLEHASLETFTLSADHFPAVILDELFVKEGDLAEMLGATFDLRIGLEKVDDSPLATIYFSSPNLSIPGALLCAQPNWHLQKPLTISFTPPIPWLRRYLPDMAITQVGITVKDFQMDDGTSITTHIEAAADIACFKNYPIRHPQLFLNIEGLDHIILSVQADGLKGAWSMSYDQERHRLTTKDNIQLLATLDPASWRTFSSSLGSPTELVQPVEVTLSINPFILRMGAGMLQSLALDGTLRMNDFVLMRKDKPKSRFALKGLSCRWKLDQPRGEFSTSGIGQISGATNTWSDFHLEGLFRRAPSSSSNTASQLEILCKCAVDQLDTTALDIWVDTSSSLAPLLGSLLSLKLDTRHTPTASAFSLSIKSDRLQLECGLARDRNQLVLRSSSQPITCNWTLFPEGYALLADLWRQTYREAIPVTLVEPCQLAMRIDTLTVPLLEKSFTPAPDALIRALFSGNFSIERLPLTDTATGTSLTFQHIALQMQRQNQTSPLQLHLKSAIEADKPGLVDVRGSIEGVSGSMNVGDLSQLHVNIVANFQDVPTSLPDLGATLAGLEPHSLATIFGPTLTGSLQADVAACSGPISLQINTASTRLAFKGQLDRGVLALQEPLLAQVTMTEDLSRMLLQKTNPLSLDIVTSEGPMTLTVDKEGFSLPVYPWKLSAAAIPHARIDLGKITCHNKGNLYSMLGLLKLGQFSRQKDLKLWFAPLDISLKESIVECSRTEILVADRLEIATWGQIDLNRNRVNAVLGLTASALENAFGIKNLPQDYVLQLPMKGPIGDVQIDTSKATAKIALLLAWQKGSSAAGGILGGPQGAIVGGLLGKLAQLPDINAHAPPANHPFPWEVQQPSESTPAKKKRKTALKPGDKPLKQLLKLIR